MNSLSNLSAASAQPKPFSTPKFFSAKRFVDTKNLVMLNGWKCAGKASAAVTVLQPADSIPICRCWNCG